ncbi:ABC-three component system protein [Pseudomonas fortuita]|uniref:ABC-three component system protein n=1 Tax=Pseudomonas fortuita TaxID=3233375 RepID=UPI003DA0A6EF
MIRRFRLEQKGRFEKLVIAERLSDMLDKFLGGQPAPLRIGAEQGGIPQWDDVVIEHSEEHWEHLQIKRQASCFSKKAVDKGYYSTVKPRKTEKKEPDPDAESDDDEQPESELEKVMISLATLQLPPPGVKPSKRTFTLTLPGPEVVIKGRIQKELITINYFRDLWDLCTKDGVNLAALEQRNDGPTQLVYTWLTTWCGFRDWAHIVERMKILKIDCIGLETTLESSAQASLDRHFTDAKSTLSMLMDYISESTTDTNAISCHHAAKHLHKMRRSGSQTWTQYLATPSPGQGWNVAGTHDLDSEATASTGHPANQVVLHHWADGSLNRKLHVHAGYTAPVPGTIALPSAILRLALHLNTGTHCMLLGEPQWRQGASQELGSTLGIEEDDLDALSWHANSQALSCALGRDLPSHVDARAESGALYDAMDDVVWLQLQSCIEKRLGKIRDSQLLDAMESKWQRWRTELSADKLSRQKLFEQLMYPKTEGLEPKHALRIGPRTVNLMETAVIILLLVCVGLGKDDGDWRSIPEIGDVLSIAVRHWSGGAADNYGPRRLIDGSLREVIGNSTSSVVILAGLEASATSMSDSSMADDLAVGHSMAAERQPRLTFTRFEIYRHMQFGTLASLSAYVQKQWDDWRISREQAVEACGKGY